jgi:hypothetical protein
VKKMKIWKLRIKRALLYIGSFLCGIAPLGGWLLYKWDKYTTTPAATVKLCAGGVLVAVFILLAVLGRLKLPGRLWIIGILLGIVYFLEPLLPDLRMILTIALASEAVDMILFRAAIKHTRERITVGKTANATTAQVEEILKKYIGSGRV